MSSEGSHAQASLDTLDDPRGLASTSGNDPRFYGRRTSLAPASRIPSPKIPASDAQPTVFPYEGRPSTSRVQPYLRPPEPHPVHGHPSRQRAKLPFCTLSPGLLFARATPARFQAPAGTPLRSGNTRPIPADRWDRACAPCGPPDPASVACAVRRPTGRVADLIQDDSPCLSAHGSGTHARAQQLYSSASALGLRARYSAAKHARRGDRIVRSPGY
ncbi:hypothetical protein C2E23DRAFT_522175 [Lenzites betulinus]|nr:hypothetical protein C2E23DRAFT_522175 [Lenzites betulinus]